MLQVRAAVRFCEFVVQQEGNGWAAAGGEWLLQALATGKPLLPKRMWFPPSPAAAFPDAVFDASFNPR
jgi:hypothetical protein